MIWDKEISFEGLKNKSEKWYKDNPRDLGFPPIDPQFALDLIFKTLIDDEEDRFFLTTLSESVEQINYIKLDLILYKYSQKYRKMKNK